LSPRYIYEDQLKLEKRRRKKGEVQSTKQPCKDVRKSENNGSIE